MEVYSKFIILALLAESIVEKLKIIYENGKFNINKMLALAICCAITVFTGSDLFGLLGINFNMPIIGQLFTGVLISRGAGKIGRAHV